MYWDHVRAMSPAERYHKALRLNASVRAIVETRIRERQPNLSGLEMKFAVARRYYWNEPRVLEMLDEAEKSAQEFSHE